MLFVPRHAMLFHTCPAQRSAPPIPVFVLYAYLGHVAVAMEGLVT